MSQEELSRLAQFCDVGERLGLIRKMTPTEKMNLHRAIPDAELILGDFVVIRVETPKHE